MKAQICIVAVLTLCVLSSVSAARKNYTGTEHMDCIHYFVHLCLNNLACVDTRLSVVGEWECEAPAGGKKPTLMKVFEDMCSNKDYPDTFLNDCKKPLAGVRKCLENVRADPKCAALAKRFLPGM